MSCLGGKNCIDPHREKLGMKDVGCRGGKEGAGKSRPPRTMGGRKTRLSRRKTERMEVRGNHDLRAIEEHGRECPDQRKESKEIERRNVL